MIVFNSNIYIKYIDIMVFLLLIVSLLLLSVASPLFCVVIINIFIILSYILYRPKSIFHPNNIVFAFSFLYVFLPSILQLIYDTIGVTYELPWGRPTDWFGYSRQTYYDMYLLFIILFYSFHLFNINDKVPEKINYRVNSFLLYLGVIITCIFLVFYVNLTGGLGYWIANYKEAFLTGRKGIGLINIGILFLVNLIVFLLGLAFKSEQKNKYWIWFVAMILIVSSSFLQGLKSRIIILLVIFYFPYLLHIRINTFKIILLGFVFFIFLYIGTYIRSNGFYNSPQIFLEYVLTYFNVYDLHDLIVSSREPGFFETAHHFLVKPLQAIGILNTSDEYDLSITYTKQFFPENWESMQATQQWPVVTELYLNYYGFLFGWIPLIIYAFLLSIMYQSMKRGNVSISLIFILEFIRLFTVQRGVLIPWQMPIYLILYIMIFITVRIVVRRI